MTTTTVAKTPIEHVFNMLPIEDKAFVDGKCLVSGVDVTDAVVLKAEYDEYQNRDIVTVQVPTTTYATKGVVLEEMTDEDKARLARKLVIAANSRKAIAERADRRAACYSGIISAIKAAGHTAERPEGKGLVVDGQDIGWDLSVDVEHDRGYNQTGKLRVVVGRYGNRTSFPQRKDGSHSYYKIAQALIGIAARHAQEAQVARARADAKPTVDALVRKYGKKIGEDHWYTPGGLNLKPSQSPDKPVFIEFKLGGAVTAERAEQIIEGLAALGLYKVD
jgi:hypothetical protein